MISSFHFEAARRLSVPGHLGIVLVVLPSSQYIDTTVKMIDPLGTVIIAQWLFDTGQFEYVRAFAANGDKVINYEKQH